MISKGKIKSAQKIVLYAPEGFGKSTFASKAPDPVFIDTEGSTKQLDVARFDGDMTDWREILKAVDYVLKSPTCCKTLVIDTADWAEQACINYTVSQGGENIKGIEDFGYGKGYVYAMENFKALLDKLNKVIDKGINVLVTAHAQMRKFEQPDEMGAYDRWEMKLSKKDAPLLKEWADVILFGNYKTYVVEDSKTKSKKAQGGNKRVMYATHHACWDAKNRHGLPDEMPFEIDQIAHLLKAKPAAEEPKKEVKKDPEVTAKREAETDALEGIPDKLKELMKKNDITEWDIQNAVASLKNSPYDSLTPIKDYAPDFVQNMLIDKFDGLLRKIQKINIDQEIPFN